MSNQLKGRLWLMGFGLNLSGSVLHGILHNYVVAVVALIISYVSFEIVVRNYIDKVLPEATNEESQ